MGFVQKEIEEMGHKTVVFNAIGEAVCRFMLCDRFFTYNGAIQECVKEKFEKAQKIEKDILRFQKKGNTSAFKKSQWENLTAEDVRYIFCVLQEADHDVWRIVYKTIQDRKAILSQEKQSSHEKIGQDVKRYHEKEKSSEEVQSAYRSKLPEIVKDSVADKDKGNSVEVSVERDEEKNAPFDTSHLSDF